MSVRDFEEAEPTSVEPTCTTCLGTDNCISVGPWPGLLTSCSAELSMICHKAVLVMQAMGLGCNPHSILGASGRSGVKGLGFRFRTDER